jgi:hypothetical protein
MLKQHVIVVTLGQAVGTDSPPSSASDAGR